MFGYLLAFVLIIPFFLAPYSSSYPFHFVLCSLFFILCSLFFFLCSLHLFPPRAGDTRHRASSSSSSNPSQDPIPSPTPTPAPAVALVGILRHPSLLDLLIIAFVHPSKQLPSPTHIHTARLLALICGSYYEENPELGIISAFLFFSYLFSFLFLTSFFLFSFLTFFPSSHIIFFHFTSLYFTSLCFTFLYLPLYRAWQWLP